MKEQANRHTRNSTLECAPLGKCVTAFSADALPDSTAACAVKEAAAQALADCAPAGDCIPAHHAAPLPPPPLSKSPPSTRPAGKQQELSAPAGSAWNPWQGQGAEPPLPLRRVVAHKPNPSWFAPIVGFGGPPSLLWQEQQQQEQALRRSQQEEREQQAQAQAQQEHHMQGPDLKGQQQAPAAAVAQPAEPQPPRAGWPSSQPLAYDVGKLQQSLPHSAASHRQLQQRSPPWYSQGWQQQQQAPLSERPQSKPQPDAASSKSGKELQVYPGGNPFSEAVPLGSAAGAPEATATTAATAAQPGSAVAPQLPPPVVGSMEAAAPRGSTRRKLPPPPRFLVVRSVQVGQQVPEPCAAVSQPSPVEAGSEPAPPDVQAIARPAQLIQPPPLATAPATTLAPLPPLSPLPPVAARAEAAAATLPPPQALAAACESGAASGGAACPFAAAGDASQPPVAPAGSTSMQALKPADIIAAAGRLRSAAAPSPEVAGASSPGHDPPVELLVAIQQGAFKLQSVAAREQDLAVAAGPALGGPSAGAAELLRRVA